MHLLRRAGLSLAQRQLGSMPCASSSSSSSSSSSARCKRTFVGSTVFRQASSSSSGEQADAGQSELTEEEERFLGMLGRKKESEPGEAPNASSSQPSSSQKEGASTYMEHLFSSPDAFDRDEDIPLRHRRTKQAAMNVGQSILQTQAYERARHELNKEWGDALSSPSSSKSGLAGRFDNFGGHNQARPSSGPRFGAAHMQRSRPTEKMSMHPLTKEEFAIFEEAIGGIEATDFGQNRGNFLFGSKHDVGHDQKLRSFWTRMTHQRQQMRLDGQRRGGGRGGLSANRPLRESASALIRERFGAEKLDQAKVDEMIDSAREQLKSCSTQQEAWQWALTNVWAPMADGLEADGQTQVSSALSAPSSEERTFGVQTPYYAPVLHLLCREFRTRFRAPYMALAVLRVTRDLGPESSVLGCTPHLYAEAIQTCWNVLRDVQGARDLVMEAKETGILSGAFSASVLHSMTKRFEASHQRSPDELANLQDDQMISRVVEFMKRDVDGIVIRAQRSISSDGEANTSSSSLLQRQKDMVSEMSNAISAGGRTRDGHASEKPKLRQNKNFLSSSYYGNRASRTVATNKNRHHQHPPISLNNL